jgi:hypothetical protein
MRRRIGALLARCAADGRVLALTILLLSLTEFCHQKNFRFSMDFLIDGGKETGDNRDNG